MTCIAQIWDNGDTTTCDKPTGHPDNSYCPRCRKVRLEHLAVEISAIDLKRRSLLEQQQDLIAENARA